VGAAAVRQTGTRPIPTTPAAKAAALTREATGGGDESDGVTLAEEGPRSRRELATTIPVEDLPPSYQESLQKGIEVDDRAAADERVNDLRLQALACRWAQANGETCRTVAATWTPPTATPTPSATSPTPTPSSSLRTPAPSGTSSPVAS
jgi:hypothetical protein